MVVTISVTLPAEAANHAPVITSITGGNPNQDTGAVVYTVAVTDQDAADTVTVTPSSGIGQVGAAQYVGVTTAGERLYELTYTPTPRQRVAAYSGGATTDTLSVVASDGSLEGTAIRSITVDSAEIASVATLPDGASLVGPIVFGSDGTGYVTSGVNGLGPTRVTVIGGSNPGPIDLTGSPAGGPVVGPDGTVYQTIRNQQGANQYTTVVYAISGPQAGSVVGSAFGFGRDPVVVGGDGRLYLTTSGGSGTSLTTTVAVIQNGTGSSYSVPGEPSGGVVIGSDGTAYQTTYTGTPQGVYTTRVLTVGGSYATLAGGPQRPVEIGSDGVARQITVDYNLATISATTRVQVLSGPDAGTSYTILGTDSNASTVVIGADGTAYLTTTSPDGATATVTAMGGPNPGSVEIPGRASGSAVIAPDGTVYQATHTGDFGTGFTTTVTALGDPGTPFEVLGIAVAGPVIGADGSVILTTYAFDGPGATYVSTVRDPADVPLIEVPGLTSNSPLVGTDGTLYLTTYSFNSSDSWVSAVGGPTPGHTIQFSGSMNYPVVIAPDGTAYAIVRDAATSTTTVWALGLHTYATV
jgi:hypothetical protein